MIRAALAAHAAASQRWFSRDRIQTVGASEVGLCARRVYFSKNEGDAVYGHARDADHVDGWGARTRGSVFEEAFWAPAVKAAFGDRALYVGVEQETFVDGFLSGTPDGVIVGCAPNVVAHLPGGVPEIDGDAVLLDAKTVDPRTRLDAPKPEHVFQVQAGMGLVRDLTGLRVGAAVLSYTDASFWDEGREFAVVFDAAVYAEARRRARDVMVATAADRLKPEGVMAGGRECERCPFTAACGQARADRVPKGSDPVPTQLAETIADLARAARALRDGADDDMGRAREHEEEIRALLAEAGMRRLDHEGVSVRWSPVKGRPSYDHKAIRKAAEAAGVDVERFQRVGDPTNRLAITLSESSSPRGEAIAAQPAS